MSASKKTPRQVGKLLSLSSGAFNRVVHLVSVWEKAEQQSISILSNVRNILDRVKTISSHASDLGVFAHFHGSVELLFKRHIREVELQLRNIRMTMDHLEDCVSSMETALTEISDSSVQLDNENFVHQSLQHPLSVSLMMEYAEDIVMMHRNELCRKRALVDWLHSQKPKVLPMVGGGESIAALSAASAEEDRGIENFGLASGGVNTAAVALDSLLSVWPYTSEQSAMDITHLQQVMCLAL